MRFSFLLILFSFSIDAFLAKQFVSHNLQRGAIVSAIKVNLYKYYSIYADPYDCYWGGKKTFKNNLKSLKKASFNDVCFDFLIEIVKMPKCTKENKDKIQIPYNFSIPHVLRDPQTTINQYCTSREKAEKALVKIIPLFDALEKVDKLIKEQDELSELYRPIIPKEVLDALKDQVNAERLKLKSKGVFLFDDEKDSKKRVSLKEDKKEESLYGGEFSDHKRRLANSYKKDGVCRFTITGDFSEHSHVLTDDEVNCKGYCEMRKNKIMSEKKLENFLISCFYNAENLMDEGKGDTGKGAPDFEKVWCYYSEILPGQKIKEEKNRYSIAEECYERCKDQIPEDKKRLTAYGYESGKLRCEYSSLENSSKRKLLLEADITKPGIF